jgi:hypothetical protein
MRVKEMLKEDIYHFSQTGFLASKIGFKNISKIKKL